MVISLIRDNQKFMLTPILVMALMFDLFGCTHPVRRLVSLPMVDPKRIVFHGRSLGGSVLSELARHRRPAAIIVESTFTSIKAMAYGAPAFLLSDRYDTVTALSGYQGPILVIHGTKDDVVPVRHAFEMKRRVPTAELILYNCGHSDGPPSWSIYWKDISGFLGRTMPDADDQREGSRPVDQGVPIQ